jgi:hypothetical protein
MLATISGPISTSLGSFSKLSWVVVTFSIGCSISRPLSGHLTDIFGRCIGLILCYSLFAVGMLACGPAGHSLWIFLADRVIQDLGGGALCSITAFIETDLVPLRKRALIEGIGNIAFGVTLALGGIYGGSINDAIGWKWAFLIQVPVVVLNAALVLLVVKIPQKTGSLSSRSIDYFGCGLLLFVMAFFQYGMNSGSTERWNTRHCLLGSSRRRICYLRVLGLCHGQESRHTYTPTTSTHNCFLSTEFLLHKCSLNKFDDLCSNLPPSSPLLDWRYWPSIYTLRDCLRIGIFRSWISRKGQRAVLLCQHFRPNGLSFGCCNALYYDTAYSSLGTFVYLSFLGPGFGGAFVIRLMGILSSVDDEKQAVIQAAS